METTELSKIIRNIEGRKKDEVWGVRAIYWEVSNFDFKILF
jgi:hypothetical protein